jgi:hypothetical protein
LAKLRKYGKMSFINKSVNYSQANLLKGGLVKDLLTSYNKFYLSQTSNNCCLGKTSYIIPNNSKKFHLLISHNSRIEKTENFNLLYFFTDSNTNKILQKNKLEKNVLTDFFMEIDLVFKNEYLVEGYLYTDTNNSSNISNYHFLITDILFINEHIVNCDYSLRHALINEHFFPLIHKLNRLNDHLTISIHPVFEESNSSIVKVFLDNFCFSSQLNSFETINSFKKIQKTLVNKNSIEEKLITKTQQSDVYSVTDITSNNNQGILYIKSIKISKQLKELFAKEKKDTYKIKCQFNIQFNKWEPLF